MKTSELRNIIKEEISNLLSEKNRGIKPSSLYNIDLYMNGILSEDKFFHNLEQLNEGIGDKILDLITKTINKLKSYFNDLKKYGEKIGKILTWLIDKAKGLYKKYPNLIKALVILTIMVSLVIVSTASMAAGGEPINIDPDYLNIVIGYANNTNVDPDSLAMLIDAKDGVIDSKDWNSNDINNTFNTLRKELTEVLNNVKKENTTGSINMLIDSLKETGEKLVSFTSEIKFDTDGNEISKKYNFYSK